MDKSNHKLENNETFPGGSDGKESACNAGDLGSTPGSGKSPGGGNGNPLQWRNGNINLVFGHEFYGLMMDMNLSKLRKMMKDREAWSAAVHGDLKDLIGLSD